MRVTSSAHEEVADDLGRRRCVGDHEIDRTEPGVVVMVVDVDDEQRLLEERRVRADSPLVCTIDGEQHALTEIRGGLAKTLGRAA